MQQMYHFGIDGMFHSGNFAVTSKVKVRVAAPGSKVGEQGISTGHGKYAVMV